jgi:hypothetical protein
MWGPGKLVCNILPVSVRSESLKKCYAKCYAYWWSVSQLIKMLHLFGGHFLGLPVAGMHVEGVTPVLPSRLFMFNKYWRILALS